jgi:hypothetical protein
METDTYSELTAAAEYDDAARRYNVVALGNGANPLTWHAPTIKARLDAIYSEPLNDATIPEAYDLLERLRELRDIPHRCHCGQPLDDGACECEACSGEWQDYLDGVSERREAFGLF